VKRRPARRKAKSPANVLRPFWLLIGVLLAASAGAAYWAATWPGFWPKHVTVGGNRVVATAEILQRAAIAPDANVWLQNARAAADRVAAIPYVDQATVHRWLPANVRIDVTERRPFAVVRFADGDALVDRDLRVLESGAPQFDLPQLVLPRVSEPGAGAFLHARDAVRLRDDYLTLEAEHVAARMLRFDRFDELTALTPGGVVLMLGDDSDLQGKAALVQPILSQAAVRGRRIAAVDLRAPKTPVVRYGRDRE